MNNNFVRSGLMTGEKAESCRRLSGVALFIGLLVICAASVGEFAPAREPIKLGILSIAQPARIHANWQPFARYLEKNLGHPVEIIVPRGFRKMEEEVVSGDVDIFYVNSYVFYRLKQSGHAGGVAQMQNVDGETVSRSRFFVRADSGIHSIDQLKNKKILYVSPMGAGGYLAPRAYLYRKSLDKRNLPDEEFTRSLSNSLYRVLLGEADIGTMCGVNFRLMSNKVDTGELRVIDSSDTYAENLIAYRTSLDERMVDRIRKIILDMGSTAEGAEILKQMSVMKIGRFVAYEPESERLTEELIKDARLAP